MPVGDEVAEYTQLFRPVKAVGSKFLASISTPKQDTSITASSAPGSFALPIDAAL
jgi:hypothetical protein